MSLEGSTVTQLHFFVFAFEQVILQILKQVTSICMQWTVSLTSHNVKNSLGCAVVVVVVVAGGVVDVVVVSAVSQEREH
jgi:hypothetical protein